MIPFRLAFSETQVDRHCAKSEIVHGHVCEGRPWLELWSKCFWIQGGFDGAIFRSWTRDYVVYTWNSVDVRMLVWTISIWRVLDVPFASDSAFLFDQYLLSCKHMCWYSHAVSWRSHRPSLLVLDRLWGGLCFHARHCAQLPYHLWVHECTGRKGTFCRVVVVVAVHCTQLLDHLRVHRVLGRVLTRGLFFS